MEQLIEVLEQTMASYGQLPGIIRAEHDAAIRADLGAITASGEQKQAVVAHIQKLEQRRAGVMHRLAGMLGLPPDQMRLSVLTERVETGQQERLQQLQNELQPLIEDVAKANRECRGVIDHCLRLVKSNLGFFQHWSGTTDVYGQSGNMCNSGLQVGRLVVQG
ncbi:flagellar protein FlgN [Desulfatitalea alkaliphila]|uniref:Flagellar protein FlgN n=1 Tax=Desulfatitalea alkaliphila TaxID=2929485 RepID=A0AA41R5A9_9BACT|nr:flagellar protein FlgN [Desulfatitalea alkaliphila]